METPWICFEGAWHSFHVGLGPQPMHHDITCSPCVTQESRQLPKFETNKYAGCGMMVDPSAHQWLINFFKHLGYVWCKFENHSMWVWDHNQCTMTSFVAHVWPKRIPPQLCNLEMNKYGGYGMINVPIRIIWMFPNTLYMSGLDAKTIPHGSGASTNAQQHYFHFQHRCRWDPRIPHQLPKFETNKYIGCGMMADPSAN